MGKHGRVSIIHYTHWQFFWSKTAVALKRLRAMFCFCLMPIKSLAFVMPMLAPSSVFLIGTFSHALFLFVMYILLTTEGAWRQKPNPNGLGKQILAQRPPSPWASLKSKCLTVASDLASVSFRHRKLMVFLGSWGVSQQMARHSAEYSKVMAQPLEKFANI